MQRPSSRPVTSRASRSPSSRNTATGARAPHSRLIENDDRDFAYIVSPQGTYLGTVSADSLRSALDGHQGPLGLQHAFLSGLEPIAVDAPVADLFGQVAHAPCAVPVVKGDGRLAGVISKTTLLRFLDRDTPPIEATAARPSRCRPRKLKGTP